MHKGISVFLDVPLEALAKRIAAVGTNSRPLLHYESGDAYTKVNLSLVFFRYDIMYDNKLQLFDTPCLLYRLSSDYQLFGKRGLEHTRMPMLGLAWKVSIFICTDLFFLLYFLPFCVASVMDNRTFLFGASACENSESIFLIL